MSLLLRKRVSFGKLAGHTSRVTFHLKEEPAYIGGIDMAEAGFVEKKEKKCDCSSKHCKHYQSDFDRLIDPKEEIKVVPSPRIDYCSQCDKEHGYDCPLDKEKSSFEAEASIFFSKIADYLPGSQERAALGDEKIFYAFKQAYKEFRPFIVSALAKKILSDLLKEIEVAELPYEHSDDELDSGVIDGLEYAKDIISKQIENI